MGVNSKKCKKSAFFSGYGTKKAQPSRIVPYLSITFFVRIIFVQLVPFSSSLFPFLPACSLPCIKRNKLLTHHMLIPSHYLPLSLFLFLSKKEQVSLKLASFLHTSNHNKSTTLADCASNLCDASHFSNCTK